MERHCSRVQKNKSTVDRRVASRRLFFLRNSSKMKARSSVIQANLRDAFNPTEIEGKECNGRRIKRKKKKLKSGTRNRVKGPLAFFMAALVASRRRRKMKRPRITFADSVEQLQ